MATSSILGQYEKSLSEATGTDRIATDKDTFLKLLVAQLQNQDPLNPAEDKEFIAQLAQFTTVEELQNLNTGMDQLNESYLGSQMTSAASLIGLQVIAGGYDIYLRGASGFTSEDDYPSIYMTPPRDMESGTLNIYTVNADGSTGSLVYSYTLGQYSGGGLHVIKWPGTNSAGQTLPDGNYTVSIGNVKDTDGNDMLVETSSSGVVYGVQTSPDGNHELYLNDGRKVYFNAIDLITYPSKASDGDDDGDGDGDDTNKDDDTKTTT